MREITVDTQSTGNARIDKILEDINRALKEIYKELKRLEDKKADK